MVDREQIVMDLLCGELQTSWAYCDPSCVSCKFYHEESDMGARVPICVHGFGRSKESCGCYMTRHEYLEFVRSCFANLKSENAKLRELLTDILSYVYDGGFNCSEGTWSCPYFQECFNCPIEEGPERHVRRGCRWLVRGRELGIEVKECMTR